MFNRVYQFAEALYVPFGYRTLMHLIRKLLRREALDYIAPATDQEVYELATNYHSQTDSGSERDEMDALEAGWEDVAAFSSSDEEGEESFEACVDEAAEEHARILACRSNF